MWDDRFRRWKFILERTYYVKADNHEDGLHLLKAHLLATDPSQWNRYTEEENTDGLAI